MAKISIKQINNSPAFEGGVIVFDGNKNEWSNSNTNSILAPAGTLAERPSIPQNGHYRYNTDNNEFEFFENGAWRTFADTTPTITAIALTTGLAIGGLLSINVDTTKFDITAGNGWIVDSYTDPNVPVLNNISWSAFTAVIPLGLLTDPVTYIFIDTLGAVHQQLTFPDPQNNRDFIFLGVIVHSDNILINVVNNLPRVAIDIGAQLYDLINSLGFFNINGNIITPNGANLNINKTAGVAFKSGANYQIDRANPHQLDLPSLVAPSFRYRLQDGTEFANTTVLDPANFDNSGVLTAVSANNSTIQRVFIFPSGVLRLQYGQTVYANISAGIEAAATEIFNIEQNISDNGLLLGLIVILSNAADLTDTRDAVFLRVGRFGELGTAGSQAVGTLQQTYNNSDTPEIVVDTTRGALTIIDNVIPIGEPLFEVQSNDTLTTYFDVSVSGTSISGLNYPTTDGLNNEVLTTDGVGNLSFATAVGGTPFQRTAVTAATYTIVSADTFVGVQFTTTGAVTLTMPLGSSVSLGHIITIKDEGGNASINTITVDRTSTDTIDGDIQFIIAIDFGAIRLQWTGFEWSII